MLPLPTSSPPPPIFQGAQSWSQFCVFASYQSCQTAVVASAQLVPGLCRWAQCDCGTAQSQWLLPPYLCGGPRHLQPVLVLVPFVLLPHPHTAAHSPAGAKCRTADAQAAGKLASCMHGPFAQPGTLHSAFLIFRGLECHKSIQECYRLADLQTVLTHAE